MTIDLLQEDSIWDVVVVGAGPAGGLAAIRLADAGLRVMLAERKPFPRDKVCGGCLNARALTILDDFGLGRIAFEASGSRVERLSVRAGGQSLDLAIPAGMAICRGAFDEGLAREASARGVRFITGVTASVVPKKYQSSASLKFHEIRLEVVGRRAAAVRARVVVLAGGLQSAVHVAPHLLISRVSPTSRIGVGTVLAATPHDRKPSPGCRGQSAAMPPESSATGASQAQPPGTPPFNCGTVYMSVADGGYAGAVCLADGRLIIAAALDRQFVRQNGSVSAAVQSIFALNGWTDFLSTDSPAFRGTPQLTRSVIRPAAERLFVIGDAAGYVEPFTGEGMASALVAAAAVTPYVARSVTRWESHLAAEWTHEHRRLIQHRQTWCRTFATLLRSPWLTRAAVSVASRWPNLSQVIAQRVVGNSASPRSDRRETSYKSAVLTR